MTLSIKCSHTLLGQLGLFGSLVIFCGALWAQNPPPPFIPDVTGFSNNTTVAASTVATALDYPYGMVRTSAGILVGQTSPNTPGGIEGGPSTGSVWLIPTRGPAQQVISNLGGVVTAVRASRDGLILVDSGAGSGRHMTFYNQNFQQIADVTFQYSDPAWDHSTGMSFVVPRGGADRIFFIVGSEFDSQPTTGTVTASGLFTSTLNPDSVYMIDVQYNGSSVRALGAPQQVAKGLRNPYGITLDANSNLVIGDNGQDGAHNPNEKGADTLNVVPRSQIGTTVLDFGFPNTYTDFNTGTRINPQPGVSNPLVAFIPVSDSHGVLQYSEGLSGLDFVAPPCAMPFVGGQGGVFVGFHGVKNGTGSGNTQNAFLYYDFASGRYYPIVDGGTNGVGHLNTVLVSGNSLFLADFATAGIVDGPGGQNSGAIYEFTFSGTGIALCLTPSSLSFGNQAVATTSAVKKVTVKNTGAGQLTFTNITINGINSGDFAQTDNCTGSIAAGKSCTVNVTFTPSATGTRSAELVLTDDAAGSPQSVPLTGTGVAQAVVSPTSLAFPAQKVGTTSAAKTVKLTNNLSTALPFTVTFNGADPGDFASPTNTCGSSVPAKGKCTISVTFKPGATGARSATMNVNDSANNSPQTVSLTGTGK
jgi:glucose/arabinose dehydrogenase